MQFTPVTPIKDRRPKGSWSDQRVLDAWHGPLTLAQIAARSRRGASSTISRIWKEAKDAGELPPGDRPHFPQVRRTVAPPIAAEHDTLQVASVMPVSGYPTVITELLQLLAAQPSDEQFEAVCTVAAAVIISQQQQQHLMMADLLALRARAKLRRHFSGEQRLPTIAYYSDKSDVGAAFDDSTIMHVSA